MKKLYTFLIFLSLSISSAQEVIQLPHENPADVKWTGGEKAYFSDIWNTEVVTNVSTPSMQAFIPDNPNGTAVIIAPGGGLYALSIESEGNMVANWLKERGIAAFVLKYRLVPSEDDGVKELMQDGQNNQGEIARKVGAVIPFSVQDGLAAINHVRTNASEYGIDPAKIGFMGFSAGGAVTMGVGYNYTESTRPDYLVPVYPWTDAQPVQDVPATAPPMLVICANDDPLGLAKGSTALYESWREAGKPAGLHMYAKGGHGFGMRPQGLPSDTWIQRFHDWAVAEGITQKP